MHSKPIEEQVVVLMAASSGIGYKAAGERGRCSRRCWVTGGSLPRRAGFHQAFLDLGCALICWGYV